MTVGLRVVSKAPARCDALVAFEGHGVPKSIREELDRQWSFRRVAIVPTLGRMPEPLLVALKTRNVKGNVKWSKLLGAAGRVLVRERATNATVDFSGLKEPLDAELAVVSLTRGLYTFLRYKTEPKPPANPRVAFVAPSSSWSRAAKKAIHVAEGTKLARDLVNTPAEDMGPSELTKVAKDLAGEHGLKFRVLDHRALERKKMGAISAVGRASDDPPRIVVLEYRGAARSKDWLALCGKGVCFDTGGLNLKPADGMLLMKKDMGGAATMVGVARAVAGLKPKANIRFYLGVVENSVSGNAIRPGDIVRAMNGTTIEIGNTDAEGRLVLADTLCLAVEEGATRIVDAATLTGAAMVALGHVRVPLLGNDAELVKAVEDAADTTGERVWKLPVDPEYREAFRGTVADLKNVGRGAEAGVMAGGLFIGHFAGDVPWAHLDISPASWATSGHDLGPVGATGVMVPTLTRLACSG